MGKVIIMKINNPIKEYKIRNLKVGVEVIAKLDSYGLIKKGEIYKIEDIMQNGLIIIRGLFYRLDAHPDVPQINFYKIFDIK